MTNPIHRCSWAESDPLMRVYHDNEWGIPEHDSRALWEALMLDGFQAGLSWLTILRKRDAFRKAFRNFDPKKVARMGEDDIARLLQNEAIIRSRAKIEATISDARIFLSMAETGEDFYTWIWSIAGKNPIQNRGPSPQKLRSPKRSPQRCENADLNSSGPSSSTPGCRPAASSTTTTPTVSVAKQSKLKSTSIRHFRNLIDHLALHKTAPEANRELLFFAFSAQKSHVKPQI